MHLGPRKKPRDRQAAGPAKTPSQYRAELAGSALEDPAFPLRGSSTLRGSEWLGGETPTVAP
jgi:hypothetical protein